MDKNMRVVRDGGLAIDDGSIVFVGSTEEAVSSYHGEKTLDGKGMIAIPGLINAHTHMYQDLLRGLGDDMGLMEWLEAMMLPNNAVLSPEDVYIGSLLGCIEQLKTGTTLVVDNLTASTSERSVDNVAKAIKESGIRGMIARGVKEITTERKEGVYRDAFYTPEEEVRITARLMDKWNNEACDLVKVCPGPISTLSSGAEQFQRMKELSDKYKVPIHTHVAEVREEVENTLRNHGMREVEYLHSIGVLGPRFHAVHGVWLNSSEMRLLAESGAHLIHCPVSNMILASGVSPVIKMLDLGVNVALGTDGPASNNNQDMVGVLKATSLLHKVSSLDPKAMPCEKVLEMATLGGARALGMEEEIGSLEPGKRADVVLVDVMKPHIMPIHNPVSALVYSAMGSDVHTVIVDGKIVVEEGVILKLDERMVLERSQEVADELVRRSKTSELRNRKWPI
jgi:5-methylthioadenosine/S-adenosylhomocysteine deaminase